MPFREIKPPKDFVRIKKDGSTTISVTLVNEHFVDKRVRVFHDLEAKKIGLQPSSEGYKITKAGGSRRIWCRALATITTGEFYPEWNATTKMLVFSY